MSSPWWHAAVFYQVYPRSFADSNGDGIGDLAGIRAHLDHLTWLGVDAVWLSPFYRSPMADFGYDVSDHCDVDPLFGDRGGFDALLTEAHERGLRVIVDLVPNHTSDQHAWFQAARSSRDDPHRSWYVWQDGGPDGEPPNNWVAAFTNGPAWTFDEETGQWYLHLFLPEQPDLNWTDAAAVEAMHGVMRFWLDRGVDGFRADVIHCIGKGPFGGPLDLSDDEPPWAGLPHCISHEHPSTHDHIRRLRSLVDEYPQSPVLIGETAVPSTSMVAPYYGHGDELHLAFNFAATYAPWDADKWRTRVDRVLELLDPRGGLADVGARQPRHVAATAPATAAPRREHGHRRSCPSGCAARRSSMPARSSAWKTPRCRPNGWSTPAAATAAAHPCRGPGPTDTAGVSGPGCRSRPTPQRCPWRRSATTPARCCTSTAGCWPPAGRHQRCS